MATFTVDNYSHGFTIKASTGTAQKALLDYCKGLSTFEKKWDPLSMQRRTFVKDVYAAASPYLQNIGFVNGDWKALRSKLYSAGFTDVDFTHQVHRASDGVPIEVELRDWVSPREEQVPVVEFLTRPQAPTCVLPMRTGGGKTISTIMSIAKVGRRACLSMARQHIITWMKSIEEFTLTEKDEIFWADGQPGLTKLIKQAKAGECNYKFIFITVGTMRGFIKRYLATGHLIEGVSPRDLMSILGVGILAVDESHENVHAMCIAAIHTHVAKVIYLSATIVTDNKFTEGIYDKLFPQDLRFSGGRENDHVEVYPVFYRHSAPKQVKCKGKMGYSHIMYEAWLLEDERRMTAYYDLVNAIVGGTFMKSYKKGQKALLFCATIDFCKEIARRLDLDYRDQGIVAKSYNGTDAYSVLYDSDIVVSTVGSAGTGKDIPNMMVAVSCIAIGSVQKNLQMLGRPRPPKDFPGIDPQYFYLVASDIKQHLDYDKRKRAAFTGMCRFVKPLNSNKVI